MWLVKNFNEEGRLVMGYALFAQRKIMLLDQINNFNLDLIELTNKKNKLSQLSTAVADKEISAMDLAQCQDVGLALAYKMNMDGQLALNKTSLNYQTGRGMIEKEANEQYGGSRIGNTACGAGAGALIGGCLGGIPGALIGGVLGGVIGNKASARSQAKDEQIDEYNQAFNETQLANIIEDIQKDIAEMENKIDKQQANIETKLTAAQSELESVKNAEAKAIEASTPKYGGLQ